MDSTIFKRRRSRKSFDETEGPLYILLTPKHQTNFKSRRKFMKVIDLPQQTDNAPL